MENGNASNKVIEYVLTLSILLLLLSHFSFSVWIFVISFTWWTLKIVHFNHCNFLSDENWTILFFFEKFFKIIVQYALHMHTDQYLNITIIWTVLLLSCNYAFKLLFNLSQTIRSKMFQRFNITEVLKCIKWCVFLFYFLEYAFWIAV